MNSDFYKTSVLPLHLCIVLITGLLFPLVLILVLVYGKKKQLLSNMKY